MNSVPAPPPPDKSDHHWAERAALRNQEVREFVEELIAELGSAVRTAQDCHAAEFLAALDTEPLSEIARDPAAPSRASEAVIALRRSAARERTLLAGAEAREAFDRATGRLHDFAYMLWPERGLWADGCGS